MNGSDTLFDTITRAIALSGVQINYLGGGSGTGETALLNHTQGIAPMSRNLAAAIIGPGGTHPSWAPQPANILSLDATVVVQKNVATKCPNIQEFKSLPNNPATHWLQLVLGGIDGSGSTAACSHAARLEALQALSDCANVLQIDHFYRRDDNSGTTDTVKEKLGICNFCNGNSRGPLNTNNPDNDPIRRACVSGPSFAPTPCTNGTLGLVVALSQADPGSSDVTVSLGKRVALDPNGQTLAYAGREAAFSVPGATKVNIHTIVPSVANVRVGLYDLSRRLFLHKGDLNDPAVVNRDPTGEQAKLLAWTTGIGQESYPSCTDADGNPICGRPNMDPVMKSFGFVTCTDDPYDTPVPPNLCGTSPQPYVGPTCTACGGTGASCQTSAQCCSGSCSGNACLACRASGFACKVDGDCCSGSCDTSAFPAPSCL
jgi:phosphate transport system substrate-binding protein